MNGLSVFESFGFCLYFIGNAVAPTQFVHVKEPITLRTITDAFRAAFSNTGISDRLACLRNHSEFCKLDSIRNILAHRISDMRSVRSYSVRELDGAITGCSPLTRRRGASIRWGIATLLQHELNAITSTLAGRAGGHGKEGSK